jgi:UDP-glucuronate decarboxylase
MLLGASVSQLYLEARSWLADDWHRIEESLDGATAAFHGKRILVTGAAGFLGFGFLHLFSYLNAKQPGSEPVRIVAADSYLRGLPRWIVELSLLDPDIALRQHDVTEAWPDARERFDFIIHCASVASPKYYRMYPLQTLESNVNGLRNMLDLAYHSGSQGVLYFSSSEIYGDPPEHEIPTAETYRGNVSCIGPRACYDESKRLGETLCYLYVHQHKVPAKIVRPFNNYGPGLRLKDGRVIPDLCLDALADRDIVLYSDGSPTRTFCYITDALTGYLLVLLSSHHAEPFNIGSDSPEISMRDLAAVLLRVAGSQRRVVQKMSTELDYLKDNPQRRCPDITKARTLLGYAPRMKLETGLDRTLEWYRRFATLEDLLDHANLSS